MVTATPPICLELSHIYKSFGRHKVLVDFSLTIREREIVGIVGPNGAGKTTLFNITAGQAKPTNGTVRYKGQDITQWPAHRICRAGIGRTFQIARCFPEMTAIENVMMALWFGKATPVPSALSLDEAMELLTKLKLADIAHKTIPELPYGRQRLVELAITLGLKPEVLLLDEPAAGVPGAESHIILDAIDALPKSIGVLIIDHDMDLVFRFAERITVLVRGAVFAEGSPKEIGGNADVRAVYLGQATTHGS